MRKKIHTLTVIRIARTQRIGAHVDPVLEIRSNITLQGEIRMKVVPECQAAAFAHAGQPEGQNAAHSIRTAGNIATWIQPLIAGEYVELGWSLLGHRGTGK